MRAFFAKKPVRIAAAALGIVAVLTAAFFLAPGGAKPQSPAPKLVQGTEPAFSSSESSLPDAGMNSALEGALAAALSQSQPAAQQQGRGAADESIPASSSGSTASVQYTVPVTAAASTVPVTTASQPKTTTQKYSYTAAAKITASSITTTLPSSSSSTTTTTQSNPTVKMSIRCDTVLSNMDRLREGKAPFVPTNGAVMSSKTVAFTQGETVFSVLQREARAAGIHMEYSSNPMFNSVYIEGINNLYEFDCGELSGWMYSVNGKFPNYGCGSYTLKPGDVIEWVYTCDLGKDVGGGYAAGTQR